MVWITQPLQRKSDMTWQLVANSDEGGGFHPCCNHPHETAEAALNCEEAQKKADQTTGVPIKRKPAASGE